MCLKSVDSNKQIKSTFLRKSYQLLDQKKSAREDGSASSGNTQNVESHFPAGKTEVKFDDGFKYNPSENDFRFNFCSTSENENHSQDTTPKVANEDASNKTVVETAQNFYKMQVSDNTFRFQFPDPGS